MREVRCCFLLLLGITLGTTARAQGLGGVSAQNPPAAGPNLQQFADLQTADNILRADHLQLTAEVANLRAEVDRHRAQENYYGNALDEQANRFALIVGGLLALGAFISWTEFRREVRAVRKSVANALDLQEQKRNEMERRMRDGEIRALRIQANLLSLFARLNSKQKDYWGAFIHHVLSAATALEMQQLVPPPAPPKPILDRLSDASKSLHRVRRMDQLQLPTPERLDILRPDFKKLIACRDRAVSNTSLTLHAEMVALLAAGKGTETEIEAPPAEQL